MEDYTSYNTEGTPIETQHKDIRAEVIAALTHEEGLEVDFFFKPRGVFSRSFRKDILEEFIEFTETGELKAIHWDLSRDGIYDMLPEGMFHQPIQRKPFRNAQEMIGEFKRQQKEEKEARKFFLPVEQGFYDQRIALEREELRAMSGFLDPLQQRVFSHFWGLPVIASPQLKANLLNLLPLAHRVAGDLPFAQQCFEGILGIPVRIQKEDPQPIEVEDLPIPALGEANLGVSFVIGEIFWDYIPSISIHIGPVNKQVLGKLLPGCNLRDILELLCKYFLPCEAKNDIFIEVDTADDEFVLNETFENGRLGFTTRLAS